MSVINIEKYEKLLKFVKKIVNNINPQSSEIEVMRQWVSYENEAMDLLDEIGE